MLFIFGKVAGFFDLDVANPQCPEESGFSGQITNQKERVELAVFFANISRKLATPPASKCIRLTFEVKLEIPQLGVTCQLGLQEILIQT